MKKFLSVFLLCALSLGLAFGIFSAQKSAFATMEINPEKIAVKTGTSPYNLPHDISFMGDDVLVLNDDSNISKIMVFDPTVDYLDKDPKLINLNAAYDRLTSYNGQYFYTSTNNVYRYENGQSQPLGTFNNIKDIVVSSRGLFVIDSKNAALTKIYKYTENEQNYFEEFYSYDANIENFAYSEVAKKLFIYDADNSKIIITGENFSKNISISNITEILCDFGGNLYIFQNDPIDAQTQNLIIKKYIYEDDYETVEEYNLSFNDIEEPARARNKIIAVEFMPQNGNFALLCRYTFSGETINNVYIIKKDKLNSIISTDTPNIAEFENIDIFNKSQKIDFKIAQVTGYPSTMLYPAKIFTGNSTHDSLSDITMIEEGKKVLIFKQSGKFSYILCDNKIAVVYNNSLEILNEKSPEFNGAKVLLNRSRITLYPSSFIFTQGSNSYSFETGKIEKNASVTVKKEIEMNGVTYCYIEYGDGKSGYINKAELSEEFFITTIEPKFGKIDSNQKVNLYAEKSAESLVITTLKHKQELEILETGTDFYYIRATIDGQVYTGFVEAKYVLEGGLTNLQKMGLWILLSAAALAVIAIVIRIIVNKKKSKV